MNIGAQQLSSATITDLPGILSKEDQRKAFGKARRHTFAVSTLKVLMPLLSLAIVGLYMFPDGKAPISIDIPVSIESLSLDSKGLKMINPRYAGGNDKLGRYKIEAEYALQQVTSTHILELHKITGLIDQSQSKWIKLKATKGIYDTKTEGMDLEGKILITTNQGMQAHLQTAKVDMKKKMITTDKPVRLIFNGSIIDANSMIMNTARKRVLFSNGVKVKLVQSKTATKTSAKKNDDRP